jgi:hypothetical protein
MIDSKSQEIKAADDETYSNMLDLADELPDSSPRFILLSYPLTLVTALENYPTNLTVIGIWTHIRPICIVVLPPGQLQSKCSNELCWSSRIDEKHCRGQ